MKKHIIKAWRYFTGKKTIIGGSLVLLAKGGQAFFPDLLPEAQYEFIETLGEGIMGVGMLHKVVRTDKVNDAIKLAQNKFNNFKNK